MNGACFVLLFAFLGLAFTDEFNKEHITYYLDEECDRDHRMITISKNGFDSSVILKSSKKKSGFNGLCTLVFAVENPGYFGDGFLVTSQYYRSNDFGGCENYIDFYAGSEKITRWCNSSDIHEFGQFSSSLTMDLNTENNGTLDFEIALTVYSKTKFGFCPEYLRCNYKDQGFCVANELKCDGIRHCIEGEDQRGCPTTVSTVVPTTASASTPHSTTIPVKSTTAKTPSSSTVTETTFSTTQSVTSTEMTTPRTETASTRASTTTETTSTTNYTTTTPTTMTTEKPTVTRNITMTTPATKATSITVTTPTTLTSTGSPTNGTVTTPTTVTSSGSTANGTVTTPSTVTSSGSTTNATVTTQTTVTSTGSPTNGTVTTPTTVTSSGSTTNGTVTTATPPPDSSDNKVLAIVLGTMFAVAVIIVIAFFGYKYYKRRQGSYDRL